MKKTPASVAVIAVVEAEVEAAGAEAKSYPSWTMLQRIPSALKHCRFERLMLIPYVCPDEVVTSIHRRKRNTCQACAPRVPRVCLALVQRALCMAGVLLACTFMRRAPRIVLCMHKNPDAHNERRRMNSVGPACS